MSSETAVMSSPKEQVLSAYAREHATTMRVLRAYPTDKLDLRPHAMCKTARELGWVFVSERGLGTFAFNNGLASGAPPGGMPAAPEKWDDVLHALEKAQSDFENMIRATSDQDLNTAIKFFGGPKKLIDIPRIQLLWSLLFDEIHHRGQFSIYLRMADAKVPSIYGPTADEPWN
jgi:uncharacterized damage-inducible protein DinB